MNPVCMYVRVLTNIHEGLSPEVVGFGRQLLEASSPNLYWLDQVSVACTKQMNPLSMS